jgi:hypothetical protein
MPTGDIDRMRAIAREVLAALEASEHAKGELIALLRRLYPDLRWDHLVEMHRVAVERIALLKVQIGEMG